MLGIQAHAWTPKSEKARYGNVGLSIHLTARGPECSQPFGWRQSGKAEGEKGSPQRVSDELPVAGVTRLG